MSDTKKITVQGADPLGKLAVLVTLIFVIAKIWFPEHFPYSWWIVFSPVLISVALGIAVLLVIGLGFGVYFLIALWKDHRRKKEGERMRQERLAQQAAKRQIDSARRQEWLDRPDNVKHR